MIDFKVGDVVIVQKQLTHINFTKVRAKIVKVMPSTYDVIVESDPCKTITRVKKTMVERMADS